MVTNEDVGVEEKGKIVFFTEKTSAMTSGSPFETIIIPEMTIVNRAMVNPIESDACLYPIMCSGGCSGNAIRVAWSASGCIAALTDLSGELCTSGRQIAIVTAGH